jgi:hypothetical protein
MRFCNKKQNKMKIANLIKVIIVAFTVMSCNIQAQKKYDLFEKDNREYVLNNNISEIIEYEIGLDTSGTSMWKRVSNRKLYNKEGLLIKSSSPDYISRDWKVNGSQGATLEEINYNLKMSKTDIPSGKIETTSYEYDDKGNLISLKGSNIHITYKYDINNNEIEKCVSSEYGETVCNYKKFIYDENQKIKYSIDSLGVRASSDGRKYDLPTKKYYFTYDKKGNVVFDGTYNRKFNEQGLLISIFKLSQDNKNIIHQYEYKYDNNNRKVSETFTQQISSSWDPVTNTTSNIKTNTTRKYFYYDDKGLLKQEKTLDKNDKLISLLNYEYKFNN